jgi:hypothetical protein
MKTPSLFIICALGLFMLHMEAHGEPKTSFSLYKDYDVPISENHVVLYARSFGPDKYIVLDLTQKEARIYSPYRSEGLLHTHHMTEAEFTKTTALLRSDEVQAIPQRSDKAALDGFEFSAQGVFEGKPLKFHHMLPDNKAVLSVYEIYKYYRDTIPKTH